MPGGGERASAFSSGSDSGPFRLRPPGEGRGQDRSGNWAARAPDVGRRRRANHPWRDGGKSTPRSVGVRAPRNTWRSDRKLRMLVSHPRFLADGVFKSIARTPFRVQSGRGLQWTLPDDQCYCFTAGLRRRSGQRRIRRRTRPRPPNGGRLALDCLSRTPLGSI